MTRCTECNDYPAGTVCSYSGCPGKQRRPIAPQISDGDGWPFHMTCTPYRPADFADWRDGLADRFDLHFFALDQSGQVVPHDNRAVPHTDGIATKS